MRGWQFYTALGCLVLVAGCSQERGRESSEEVPHMSRFDVPEASADAKAATQSPGISPTAAPGVAFNYRYAFRMPNSKIAAVQEQHAATCEKLGIAKCRIVGMRYRLVDSETVEAMLAFKLDPMIARHFGKDGIAAVNAAQGMLVDSEISGVDEGANIKASEARSAQQRAELAELDRKIADKSTPSMTRSELQLRANAIRQSLMGEVQTRANSEEALANTPMVFVYGSGSSIPGWDGESPIKGAWSTAVTSFMTALGVILTVLGVALPWVLLGVLLLKLGQWLGLGRFRSWLFPQKPVLVEEPKPDPSD